MPLWVRERGAWALPVLVFVGVWAAHGALDAVAAGLAAVVYVFVVARRPVLAITVLLLGLVFNTLALALLLRIGFPAQLVRAAGYWKEGVIAGLAVAALLRRPATRFDALDIAALAYVVLGAAYLVIPHAFLNSQGGIYLTFSERLLGWRSDVFYVLIFVITRHLRLDRAVIDRLLKRFLAIALIVAGVGVFEFVASGAWNAIAVHGFGVQTYKHVVLHTQPGPGFRLSDVRVYSTIHGHRLDRIGSVLFDYLEVGFIFVIGLGVAGELITRGRAARWVIVSLPVLGLALLLTETRSAIIAGAVTLVVALRKRPGKTLAARARYGRILALVAIVGVPVIIVAGLAQRFGGAQGSNDVHRSSFHDGVYIMQHAPLGRGLSTAAGGGQLVAQRSANGNFADIVTETQYLQVGTQLGDAGLVIYVVILLLAVAHLWRRPRDDPDPAADDYAAPGAMCSAAIGTIIGAIFTQPFTGVEVAWIFWAFLGLAVSVGDRPAAAGTDRAVVIGAPRAVPAATLPGTSGAGPAGT